MDSNNTPKINNTSVYLSSPGRLKIDNRGFTLVELLVVCAILVVLSLMALSGLTVFKEQAKNARCISEIRGIERDISAWAIEKGSYPTLADVGRDTLRDPWGHPYEYKVYTAGAMRHNAGIDINSDYDLYSMGGDGVTDPALSIIHADSLDDIVRGLDGGYAGLASKLF